MLDFKLFEVHEMGCAIQNTPIEKLLIKYEFI